MSNRSELHVKHSACSRCTARARPGQRTCAQCHRVYMVEWRARQKAHRIQIAANYDRFVRSLVAQAVA